MYLIPFQLERPNHVKLSRGKKKQPNNSHLRKKKKFNSSEEYYNTVLKSDIEAPT